MNCATPDKLTPILFMPSLDATANDKAASPSRASILVVDDKEQMREVLRKFLAHEGYQVETAASANDALACLAAARFDLILSDIKMPGMDGIELLEQVRSHNAETIVILMTAFGSIEAAVSAIKRGAADYVSKPFEIDDVLLRIKRALKERGLRRRVADLERRVAVHEAGRTIIGQSAPMKKLRQVIERVAPLDDTVLITGETGTGKELVARALHTGSQRTRRPFVALDCSAIPETLIESELFGHERGAFTGATETRAGLIESAGEGTLFLDEVESLALSVQTKLLRVLQERVLRRVGGRRDIRIAARVVAATNRDLAAEVEANRFRHDLYYRIAVIPINVPPLRERLEDVPELIAHLLLQRAVERGEKKQNAATRFTPEAMRLLTAHAWPGNVRELENAIHYATALGGSGVIGAEDLPATINGNSSSRSTTRAAATAAVTLEEIERRHILSTLESVGGNQAQAAKLLGIDRRTLYNKLHQWNVQ